MPLNPLRSKLAAGHPVFGVLGTIASVQVMQVLVRSGLDYVNIDAEHSPISIESVHAMIAATNGTMLAPCVRIPHAETWIAKPFLDAGAQGIVFPLIKTKADAERAVHAARYPMKGERGWGPFYSSLRWDLSFDEYVTQANDEILVTILIEHATAIANLEDILSVPGIDVAMVVPGDMANSLGLATGYADHPEVQTLVTRAESIIRASGVTLGGHAISPDRAGQMMERGYRYLGLGPEFCFMRRGIEDFLRQIKH